MPMFTGFFRSPRPPRAKELLHGEKRVDSLQIATFWDMLLVIILGIILGKDAAYLDLG